ncbi:undecaprenyl-phosphate glucose phosphotransferase [Endozoicomonas ascidiicola]|uniref:undecaprenyl-phosphate glucose phosphotransferase n=1 Tax=Endozoicomonas ascidiicola TaxID=1698521 RepID=UPI0012F93E48|nr:undecaprenyl-phosphate glucose phosphotransferase [Endozoicomonas ascidiicola]
MDCSIAVGCGLAAEFFRFGHVEAKYQDAILLYALLVVVFSFLLEVYAPWRGRQISERLSKVLFAWLVSFGLLVGYLAISKTTESYSRLWLVYWALLMQPSALLVRFGLYRLLMLFRLRGCNTRYVLVIGTGRNFEAVQHYFSEKNIYGYRLVKVIEHVSDEQSLAELESFLATGASIDECWLSLPLKLSSFVQPTMFALRHHTTNIRLIPGLSDFPLLNYSMTRLGDFPTLDISCSPMDTANALIKRLEDIIFGFLILVLISPVMAAVAIAVKLSSSGPVFFKQQRHGAAGRPVTVYKFRSMQMHAEEGDQVTQATKGDPRVTRVGAFIRRTSLDELPQFINVLQGRMSIVGPRPHALAHNEYYKDLVQSYMQRHKVKPGITGLAQVRGFRGETDTLEKMQRRVECDLEYINSWSLWLDIKIIIATVFKGFVNPNAY